MGRGMITVMESSNINKNNNNNNNQNNNNKNNNTEVDDGVDLRNPSPARSDKSLRSAGRLNNQKAKSDKGLVRQAPYETMIPRLVLSKIEEVSLNISLVKGKNSVDAIADTQREKKIISRKGKSASGVGITTKGDPTAQPLTPRMVAARITGYERLLEGENKDKGGKEKGNNSDDTVDMEMDPLVEEGKEKRGRSRRPTTGEHVGKREKEEEKARRKEEEELNERAKMALSRNPPTGRQWEKAKVWEMEMEEELSKAPTMGGLWTLPPR